MMRTITPKNYAFLPPGEKDAIKEWLEQDGIDYKEVNQIVFHDNGTATVSRWDTNWRGMPKVNREGEVPFYDTALTTQPSLEGTP